MKGNMRIYRLPKPEAREISVSRLVPWPKGSLSILSFKNDMLNIKHNILSNRELYDNYSQICIKRYKEKVALWDRSLESS
jgi:hypothetical protein